MTISEFVSFLSDAGVIGILVLIVVGGYKRWYVWSWQYTESEKRCAEWRELALNGTRAAERAVDLASKNRKLVARDGGNYDDA